MKEIQKLIDGNKKFINGDVTAYKYSINPSIDEQQPMAVVITCSDSRVPAELIFDVGIGELFIIRNAGNFISESVLSSVEYAVNILGVKNVVVMGHTRCGAIDSISNISDLDHGLKDYILRFKNELDGIELFEERVTANIKNQANKLKMIKLDCNVYEALYDMKTGKVNFFDEA